MFRCAPAQGGGLTNPYPGSEHMFVRRSRSRDRLGITRAQLWGAYLHARYSKLSGSEVDELAELEGRYRSLGGDPTALRHGVDHQEAERLAHVRGEAFSRLPPEIWRPRQ